MDEKDPCVCVSASNGAPCTAYCAEAHMSGSAARSEGVTEMMTMRTRRGRGGAGMGC